ncbi:hypothetical protein PCASD_02135 [Puccinia coronata f. sp. avenae]|uniref:RRM domain-containing protein n=1 Tax=Puccinia coronata f. sp. avenae TaxID=200324 RepID=A0A2N5VQ00_9BASI|nr:hypothetical protein PCASD_02135 [Puccinia coronata f. sp. avenae]
MDTQETQYQTQTTGSPFLSQPLLHITRLPIQVADQDIISVLHECLRARLTIPRTEHHSGPLLSGTVEFDKLENAEKAYATLHHCYLSQHDCYLQLSHTSDPGADPKPSARPRLVKFLPPDASPGRLFSIFRPFGPIYRVALNYHHTPDGLPFFSGTAVIEFYTESQAALAQTEMHCSELDRHTIAVEEYDDRRDRSGRGMAMITSPHHSSSKWAQAAPFVPLTPSASLDYNNNNNTAAAHFARRPSQQSELSSADGHHPQVSRWANAQNQHQPYLLNPNTTSSPAASPVTSKWASPQTPQVSGPTSPDSSAAAGGGGGGVGGQKQVDPCNLFIKGLSPEVESGDLFHAFKQFGTIVSARVMKNEATGVSKQFGFVSFTTELATSNALKAMNGATIGLSPNRIVVRLHELKKIKDGRPVKIVPTAPSSPLHPDFTDHHSHQAHEPPVSLLAKLQASDPPAQINVGEQQTTQQHHAALGEPIDPQATVGAHTSAAGKESGLTVQTGGGSRLSSTLGSPTSSVSVSASVSGGGGGGSATERERMAAAVGRLQEGSAADVLSQLVELLMALPARDRKLCLFNPQVLATKVAEAREIIDTPDELVPRTSQAGPPVTASNLALVNSTPARSAGERVVPVPPSSTKAVMGSSTQEDSVPPSPSTATEITSLAELGKLPVAEIVALMMGEEEEEEKQGGLRRMVSSGILPKQTAEWLAKKRETEAWLDAKILPLASVHQQKQKVGERLFKLVKSFGLRNAPKITVDLLDSIPLRPLALLMALFPDALRLKVAPPPPPSAE